MHQIPVEDKKYYHREIILRYLLNSGLILSVIAILPALLLAFRTANYRLLIIDLALTAVFIFNCYYKGLKYKNKVFIVLLIIYLVSINVVLNLGFLSGAPAWFFFAAGNSGSASWNEGSNWCPAFKCFNACGYRISVFSRNYQYRGK